MSYPENFIKANEFTKKWEKGYVNHPNDPGGATYNGISLMFIKDAGIDINEDGFINAKDIEYLWRNGRQDLVDQMFYEAFWRDYKIDRYKYLPIQTALYDTYVNTGPKQTARILQRACNQISPPYFSKLEVDGIIGPLTFARAMDLSANDRGLKLSLNFLDRRMDFYNQLVDNSPYPSGRDYRPFAAGWRNRVNDLKKYVKEL